MDISSFAKSGPSVMSAVIFFESTTAVEHAGHIRDHVTMDGGVRQGCLISGFLFTMTFGPIFR